MTRKEAIDILMSANVWNDEERTAWEVLVPELAESEDERIIRAIIDALYSHTNSINLLSSRGYQMEDIETWLEKQKENIEKEYVFRPLAGTDITIAAKQAIRKVDEGDRLVLAFNGAYIPVRKGCSTNKIVDIYDAFIEKQKETGIHWFKSDNVKNPDKPYIDKAGMFYTTDGRMCYASEIEKQKELPFVKDVVLGYPGLYFYDGERMHFRGSPVMEEKQQEQKHTLKFKVGDKVHLEGDDVNILTITGIEKDRYLTDNSYGPILFGAEDIWQIIEQKPAEKCDLVAQLREYLANTPKEQLEAKWKELEKWNNVGPTVEEYLCGVKPAEWSEDIIRKAVKEVGLTQYQIDWFKTNVFPSKQEWSEEDRNTINAAATIVEGKGFKDLANRLKSLRSQYHGDVTMTEAYKMGLEAGKASSWKPSKEQVEALEVTMTYIPEFYKPKSNLASLLRDLKKQV